MSLNFSSIEADLIRGLPTAFVALVVGMIAAGIAWRQYRVARTKLKLDLFDKRYAIFEETWSILSSVTLNGTTATQNRRMVTPFNNLIPKSGFLFGGDVEDYLNDAAERWAKLWSLELPRQTKPLSPDETRTAEELRKWFRQEASEGAKKVFGRYLSFDGWK